MKGSESLSTSRSFPISPGYAAQHCRFCLWVLCAYAEPSPGGSHQMEGRIGRKQCSLPVDGLAELTIQLAEIKGDPSL